jgi:hypothetical protein
MRHPANRSGAHGTGTTDLKDGLRTHRVLAALGSPVEPCFRMEIPLTGAPPEGGFATIKQILAPMRHRRPHVLPAGPTILLAPPRGERKGEVQSNNHVGFGLTKLKKLRDELTTVEPVSQLSQLAVADPRLAKETPPALWPCQTSRQRSFSRDDSRSSLEERRRCSREAAATVLGACG